MPSSYPEKHFFAGLPFTFADLAKLYQENEQAVALALARFQQLACGDLSRYDAIVLGIRAYAFRPELIGSSQRLLSYVENGGNLVVQYHKPEDKWKQELAPYPNTIGESMIDWRVTNENSHVTVRKRNVHIQLALLVPRNSSSRARGVPNVCQHDQPETIEEYSVAYDFRHFLVLSDSIHGSIRRRHKGKAMFDSRKPAGSCA